MIGRGPCNVSSEDTVVLAEASAQILLVGHRFRGALPSCLADFIWPIAT